MLQKIKDVFGSKLYNDPINSYTKKSSFGDDYETAKEKVIGGLSFNVHNYEDLNNLSNLSKVLPDVKNLLKSTYRF